MSFLTGSRAYGTPSSDSDYDIVLLLSEEDFAIARAYPGAQYTDTTIRMTTGKVDLIIFRDPELYTKWEEVTGELTARAPVCQSDAIQAFKDAGLECLYSGFYIRLDRN